MDGFEGYKFSWPGFLDYSNCYHDLKHFFIIVGSIIWIGTALSLFPQLYRIINNRTSYGISPLFVVLTSSNHFLLVINYLCLHNADFAGLNQYSFFSVFPRFLTFLNLFTLWYSYFPVLFLIFIFFDKEPRKIRPKSFFHIEWKYSLSYSLSFLFGFFLIFYIFHHSSILHGYGSLTILSIGKFCGGLASIFSIVHYIPQFITTYKLKDHGSLSLLMLGIQAPGGFINVFVMAFGQGEHWTTFISVLFSSSQQFFLLALCLYYKYNKNLNYAQSDKTDEINKYTDPILR